MAWDCRLKRFIYYDVMLIIICLGLTFCCSLRLECKAAAMQHPTPDRCCPACSGSRGTTDATWPRTTAATSSTKTNCRVYRASASCVCATTHARSTTTSRSFKVIQGHSRWLQGHNSRLLRRILVDIRVRGIIWTQKRNRVGQSLYSLLLAPCSALV